MGLIRKLSSASTLGLVRFESNSERRAKGMQAQGRAAKAQAAVEARRVRAEERLIAAQSWDEVGVG